MHITFYVYGLMRNPYGNLVYMEYNGANKRQRVSRVLLNQFVTYNDAVRYASGLEWPLILSERIPAFDERLMMNVG